VERDREARLGGGRVLHARQVLRQGLAGPSVSGDRKPVPRPDGASAGALAIGVGSETCSIGVPFNMASRLGKSRGPSPCAAVA
jgi:hypothetical protein